MPGGWTLPAQQAQQGWEHEGALFPRGLGPCWEQVALQDCPSLPGRRSVGRSGPERGGPGKLDHQALCLRRYYESFTNCTEVETNVVGCYWPNPLAQSFITGVHRRYFHNCSVDRQQWQDPPDEILIPLIVVPILLTLAMTGLVVWRSKRAAQVV